MRVLITGGTGFVGRWMRLTAPKDMTITALDRLSYNGGCWDEQKWDAIIHLAPVSTMRVIECARRCGCPVLYSSSGAVYDRDNSPYHTMKLAGEDNLLKSGCDVRIARLFSFSGRWSSSRER